jgi:hypothetical protein
MKPFSCRELSVLDSLITAVLVWLAWKVEQFLVIAAGERSGSVFWWMKWSSCGTGAC